MVQCSQCLVAATVVMWWATSAGWSTLNATMQRGEPGVSIAVTLTAVYFWSLAGAEWLWAVARPARGGMCAPELIY